MSLGIGEDLLKTLSLLAFRKAYGTYHHELKDKLLIIGLILALRIF